VHETVSSVARAIVALFTRKGFLCKFCKYIKPTVDTVVLRRFTL